VTNSRAPLTQGLGRVSVTAFVLVLATGILFALQDPFTVLFFCSYAAMGAILVIRQPRNTIGWLLVAIGFGFIGTTTDPGLDVAALEAGTAGFRDSVTVWLAAWSGGAQFLLFFVLMIIFPTGRLPTGPWRRPVQAVLVLAVVMSALTAFAPTISFAPDSAANSIEIPNPFAVLPALPVWSLMPSADALLVPIIGLLVIGVVSMVVRYRRASGIARLQLRWLVAAVFLMVAAVVFALILIVLQIPLAGAVWLPASLAFPMIPAAIAAAVLRYRLFEIDRLISRTIAYALVTGLLAVVFGASIIVLQASLQPFTQGQTVAVAASTLAVFALFQPVLRRVRHVVDRRFDRARYDAERTASAFSERLRDELEMGVVTGDLARTTRAALAPATVTIWIRQP
jgi:hypothetical protein